MVNEEDQPDKLYGMHGVESMIDECVIWNFNEEDFYEFMRNADGFEREGYYWTNGAVRYHSEHRVNRHFIARRKSRGGEWIYDESWDSLEDFKEDFSSGIF